MHLGYLRLREMITEFEERRRTANPAPMGAPAEMLNGHASAAPSSTNGPAIKTERERDFDQERERRDRERRESREHRILVPTPEDPRTVSKHKEDERKRSRSPINIYQ